MIRRHTSHDSKVFDGVSRRTSRVLLRSKPASSPLLITTVHQQDEPKETCSNQEQDAIEIKELCQSPRASSRYSMFNFSPTPSPSPDNSPTLSHKDLSDDSSLSRESTHTASNHTDSPPLSERRRYMVINELISTETKYIDNLNTILSTFLPTLEHVVAPRSLRLLIPAQMEQLVESHEEILATLKHRMSSDSEYYGFVGDIFSRLCSHSLSNEFFNMYRVYMAEFKIAMKTLATYESESPQFKEILTLLQQGPLCERLSLASYLLTPVQRLPRYELLLKALLKQTPVDHPDSYYIGEALSRLHKELTKLNLSIKSCQMACSANGKTPLRRGGNLSVGRRTSRKAKRTLSMLKRFVSATNIDDYSSGDSSLMDDIVKVPRMQRRNAMVTASSNSMCGSEVDLTASVGNNYAHAAPLLNYNRAVSCSDLVLEFSDREQSDFQLLTPLASEACTPSSVTSTHHYTTTTSSTAAMEEEGTRHGLRLFCSSNSSLSSLESRGQTDFREESLTPTEASLRGHRGPMFSTPIVQGVDKAEGVSHSSCNKNATLKHSAIISEGLPLDITQDDAPNSSKKVNQNKDKDRTLKHSATISEGMPLDVTQGDALNSSKKANQKKDGTLKHRATISEGLPLDSTTDDAPNISKKSSWKAALGLLGRKRKNISLGKVLDLSSVTSNT